MITFDRVSGPRYGKCLRESCDILIDRVAIAGQTHMTYGSLSGVLWNLHSIAWPESKSCCIEVFPTTIRMGDS